MGGAVVWRREIERSRKAAKTGEVGGSKKVVMLATEYKDVALPDQGWYYTTSQFGHIAQYGDW